MIKFIKLMWVIVAILFIGMCTWTANTWIQETRKQRALESSLSTYEEDMKQIKAHKRKMAIIVERARKQRTER